VYCDYEDIEKVHSCIGGECGVLYVLGVVNELKF